MADGLQRDPDAEGRRLWVLLPAEAKARGFRNALAFRRWCRRHAVPLRIDGRKQWVSPADVDRAIATLPARVSAPALGNADPAVADAVAALMNLPARSRRQGPASPKAAT